MEHVFHDDLEPENSDEAWVELSARIERAESDLRRLGLYVDQGHPAPSPDGKPRAVIICTLGDVAFSDRVQHPENYTIDKEFKKMAVDMGRDDWLDRRTRMQRNLEAGRTAMDDGDDS